MLLASQARARGPGSSGPRISRYLLMEGFSMMRWITRLAAIGLAAALIGFLWSRANSDFEDEDFDEEIPIEFDVPLESAPAGAGAPAAINDADTGDGPGANFDGAACFFNDTATT